MELFVFTREGSLIFWEDDHSRRVYPEYYDLKSRNLIPQDLISPLEFELKGQKKQFFKNFDFSRNDTSSVVVFYTDDTFQSVREKYTSLLESIFDGGDVENFFKAFYPKAYTLIPSFDPRGLVVSDKRGLSLVDDYNSEFVYITLILGVVYYHSFEKEMKVLSCQDRVGYKEFQETWEKVERGFLNVVERKLSLALFADVFYKIFQDLVLAEGSSGLTLSKLEEAFQAQKEIYGEIVSGIRDIKRSDSLSEKVKLFFKTFVSSGLVKISVSEREP